MSITYSTTSSKNNIKPLLTDLISYYPNMNRWFDNLVVDNTTPIITALNETGLVIGVAIGKKELEETKIRCVRVHPDWQSKGLGISLMDKMLDTLEDRTPLLTVSEELLHQYSRIFINRYNFKLDEVNKGMYRLGKLEYIFNR